MVLREVFRAPLPGLLAHECHEIHRHRQARQFRGMLAQRPQHRRHRALRIAGTAPPDFPVAQLGGKGIDDHVRHAHGIEMRPEQHARPAIHRRETSDQVRALRLDFLQHHLRAQIREPGLEKRRNLRLSAFVEARLVIRIHRGNADQLLQEFDG